MSLKRWLFCGLIVILTFSWMSSGIATQVHAQEDLQIVQSSDGRLSLHLPADWATIDNVEEEGVFAFGVNEDAATARFDDWHSRPALVTGEGGVMGVYSAADLQVAEVTDDTLQNFGDNVKETFDGMGAELVEDMTPIELGDSGFGYRIIIKVGSEYGFIAFMSFGDYAVIMTCTGSPETFEDNYDLLEAIMLSVRVPAEEGEVADDDEPTASNVSVARADDGSVSIVLPEGWVAEDRLAEDEVFAFGDNEEALQSRVDAFFADDASTVTVSGSGGLIQFYDYAELNLDPADPQLGSLMESLQTIYEDAGYVITGQITEFTAMGDFNGVYLIFSSESETGYLVLIGFAEKIALVTSTATPSTFVASQDLLFSVVQSVSVPAVPEEDAEGPENEGGIIPLGTRGGIDLEQVIEAEDQPFAISVPEGWVFEFDFDDEDFAFVLTFAEDQEAVDIFNDNRNPDVAGGLVFYLGDLGDQDIDELFASIAPEEADLDKTLSSTLPNDTEIRWVEYELSPGTEQAYLSYFALVKFPDNTWALVLVGDTPENFEKNKDTLEAIFKSVTIGGESGNKKK